MKVSIKLSLRDGYWYVDVRQPGGATYKAYSRNTTLDEAIERVRSIAEWK